MLISYIESNVYFDLEAKTDHGNITKYASDKIVTSVGILYIPVQFSVSPKLFCCMESMDVCNFCLRHYKTSSANYKSQNINLSV
jgi:hypothetical protein